LEWSPFSFFYAAFVFKGPNFLTKVLNFFVENHFLVLRESNERADMVRMIPFLIITLG
jgi:hypothetical protein